MDGCAHRVAPDACLLPPPPGRSGFGSRRLPPALVPGKPPSADNNSENYHSRGLQPARFTLPTSSSTAPRVYQPRFHQRTRLYAIVRDYLDEFIRVYPDRYADRFGPLRPEVEKGFRAFLHCGNPEDGFATFRCPGCGTAFIVPFSCKHWLCPSCSAKRTLDWAAWLVTEVRYDQPHFHIVATLPLEVRDYFIRERRLLGWLARSLAQMLTWYLVENGEHPRALPGLIVVPQTFGEKLNPNPHFHALATTLNVDPETGGFHETRLPSLWQLRVNWRNRVLALLERAKRIARKEHLALLARYRQGFHLNVSVPGREPERQYGRDREPRAEVLASVGKYLVRTPLTESRIAAYDGKTVTLRFRGYEFGELGKLRKKADPDYEELDALELLARLSVHVPLPRKHHCLYYGMYSTRVRGGLRKKGLLPRPESAGKLRNECRQAWARLIKHLYQDDPLKCPDCGEQMKLVRLIGPTAAKWQFAQLGPELLYYGDRGVIHRERLPRPP